MKKVTVGLIQTFATEDTAGNLERTIEKIARAAKNGAQIICLQELFRTRYFPQREKTDFSHLAETIPGETTNTLAHIAKEHGVVIIIPLFEKTAGGKYYNSAAVADADGKLLDTYRKIHVPHDELFYEKDYFADGNLGFRAYRTRYADFAVLICYDQWFPEAARAAVLQGADILFYPTAIGWIKNYAAPDGDWRDAWETIQRAHAIANGVHVAAVNRVGEEDQLKFWGGSFVCDAFGAVLKRAAADAEETLVIELNLEKNNEIRKGWGFLRNRRPDAYGALVDSSEKNKPKDFCNRSRGQYSFEKPIPPK